MIFRYFVRKNAPYENADFKFIASGEELEMTTRNRGAERTSLSTAKATSSTQRLQTCTEAATNTTITLQTKPMKRGNTDWRCLADASKRDQEMQRLKFTVKIIFFDVTIGSKSYTICTMHVKNIFPTDWGQPISLYTLSNNGFYSKLYFTMNQHR